jgi:hypothetical protein
LREPQRKDPQLLVESKTLALTLIATVLIFVAPTVGTTYAQTANRNLTVSFRDNLLSISAQDADLKRILLQVAEVTNIYVSFPKSLDRKITTELAKAPLSGALDRLLIGLNHAIVYSGPGTREAVIAEVFVLSKPATTRTPSPSRGNVRRITNRIKVYERQIESLKRNLSKTDKDSRRGKQYSRRIKNLEKNIERLEARLN